MRRARLERRTILLVGGAVVGLWVLVVFANALADASQQTASLQKEQAVNASLEARVVAGEAEIERIVGPAFREFMARSYGWGLQPLERPFALALGAPPPSSMVPLGADPVTASTRSPLDDWFDLLVGG
jgi:cell division protein FtsB